MDPLVQHDDLGGIDDQKENEHTEQIELKLFVRLKSILTVQLVLLEDQ